jgi:hypothetical protein
MYVWNATSLLTNGVPTPDAQGRFPNVQGNPNSAIPVFVVATPPTDTPPYPDNQGAICNAAGAAQGALPIKYAARPATTGPYPNNPQVAGAAIAVYLVTAQQPENGPYPNSQESDGGATPVYVVA